MEESPHKVLIVPDSLLSGEIGPSFLDRAFFRVLTAATVDEAMRIAAAWLPDVVLFSSTLPDATPARFSRRVRALDPKIRLFLLRDVVEPEKPGEETITDAQLVTPVRPSQLLLTIAALLEIPVRRAPRVATRILARLEGAFEEKEPASTLANVLTLSETGLLIEAGSPLRDGGVGTIHFALPKTDERFHLLFSVQTLMDEVQLHYGVAFLELSDGDRDRLRAYVARRRGQADGEVAAPEAPDDYDEDEDARD